jgi:putative ABC transport system permease protein
MSLDSLLRDVRYAWRTLWRSRAFAATSVATLAVGLALVTVVFTIFDAYVLRPFAVRDPYSLYGVAWRARDAGGRTFRWRDYQELRERRELFDGVVAERTRLVSGTAGRIAASFVSGDYFETIGARVLLGRAIAPFDAVTGGQPVVVLSHQGWTRLFDADPGVIGRPLTLNGQPFTVVGVMREEFAGLDDSPRDLWTPIQTYPSLMKEDLFGSAQARALTITVRLRAGITAQQVQTAVTPFVADVVNTSGEVRAELRPQATPAPFSLELVAILSPVFAAFALVLGAACANVSNIMLARANARHREIGIRLSLGASRGRVVRQLLTEGVLIACLGGIAGLSLAALLLRAGIAMLFLTLPPTAASLIRVVSLDFDYRVFLFTLAVSGCATLLFALAPALQATRLSLTHALRGEATASFRGSTLRNFLVTGQVTVSMVLLIASATLVRNGINIQATDIGIDTRSVFAINQRARGSLIAGAATALTNDPRVASVVATSRIPLSEMMPKTPAIPSGSSSVVGTSYMFVSPDYFSALGVRILRGRGFRPEEAQSEAPVAIVSAAAARAFWPGQEPLGRTIRVRLDPIGPQAEEIFVMRDQRRQDADVSGGHDVTVVGVAADVVSGMVFDGSDASHLYLPTSPTGSRAAALLVRARSATDLRLDVLQKLLQSVHADPLAFEAMPLAEALAMQMFPLRVASWIGSLLSGIALVLSVSGLYGVVSYGASQRTREIGIRMALGATAAAIVRLVMRQSARLVAVGVSIGFIVSLAALATLRAVVRLNNVSLVDGAAFAVSIAILTTAAGLAAYFPARRATYIDPSETLRADG